jgi:hypothetical protein
MDYRSPVQSPGIALAGFYRIDLGDRSEADTIVLLN